MIFFPLLVSFGMCGGAGSWRRSFDQTTAPGEAHKLQIAGVAGQSKEAALTGDGVACCRYRDRPTHFLDQMFEVLHHWEVEDGEWIEEILSKYLNENIIVFSLGLRSSVGEWLELFPDDVIYFEDEIELLKTKKISKLGVVKLHVRKKLAMDGIKDLPLF